MKQTLQRLRAWQTEHKTGLIEFALIFMLALVVGLIGYQVGVRQLLMDWARESSGLTPVDFVLPALVLAIAVPLFALRRGRELR